MSFALVFGSGCGTGRATGAPGQAATGATGPQGPAGPAGLTFRGPWSQGLTYAATDAVTFAGSAYIAIASNSDMEPDKYPASWSVLAQAGAPGTAATISIGTVTTVSPATPAAVTNSGTAAAAILNFSIPQGLPGSVTGASTGSVSIAAPLLSALGSVNLFDYTKITPDTILNPDGTLASVGVNSGLYTSDFILCAGFTTVSLNVNAGHGLAFYDSNQSFIKFLPAGLTSAPVPLNAAFFRFSTSGDPSIVVAVGGPAANIPSVYIPYGATSSATAETLAQVPKLLGPLAGKNLGVFGDSIVAATGTTWMPTVQSRTNATFTFVDGLGGRETRYAFSNYNNGAGVPGDGSGTSPAGHTLAQDLANVDLLLIELGTNDGGQYRSNNLGSPTDAPSMDPGATFSANVAGVITTVLVAKPTLRVVWMTPYQDSITNGHGGCDSVACSMAVTKAIVDTCQAYATPVINMLTEAGINSRTWSIYLVDGLHPSQAGGEKVIGPLVGQKLNLYF